MSSKGIVGALILGGISFLAGATAQHVAKQTGLLNTAIGVGVGGLAFYAASHVLK